VASETVQFGADLAQRPLARRGMCVGTATSRPGTSEANSSPFNPALLDTGCQSVEAREARLEFPILPAMVRTIAHISMHALVSSAWSAATSGCTRG